MAGIAAYNFWPEAPIDTSKKIDRILVIKHKREMQIFSNGEIVKAYHISLGRQPIGPKQFEGDNKTPEGIYIINDKNPNSTYHLNLGISYPTKEDTEYARSMNRLPGGQIKIHGLRNGLGFIGKLHRLVDWTAGCIAVTNWEIEELYQAIPIGTEIEIVE
ncbi:MAG: murein L,D-transpeptidase family protein [Candidatus Kapaibacterium sp.]